MEQVSKERLREIVNETHWPLTLAEQKLVALKLISYCESGALEALTLIEHKADQMLQGQYTVQQLGGLILSTARAAKAKLEAIEK